MFSYNEIYNAYIDCRQNKRCKIDALHVEINQEEILNDLIVELNSRCYQPTTSVCFYITKPKPREIFAADFRDRIIHHVLYNRISPLWERIFIDQSFACRPEKGTHKAANALRTYSRKITQNGKTRAYFLKMDIRNFFMSIDKHILYKLLVDKCNGKELKWLIHRLIFHDPTTDYRMMGPEILKAKIPAQKSLFNTCNTRGLPIGNLTSQFFANVYLNELDHYVKHILKCRFYVRYVDDFLLLSKNMNELWMWKTQIGLFLNKSLNLCVNPEATRIDSVFNGIDFVGYIIRPHYTICRRRVVGNFKTKLRAFEEILMLEDNEKKTFLYKTPILDKLFATVNSYLGHFSHANTDHLIGHLFDTYSFLRNYFFLNKLSVKRKYKCPKYVNTLKKQVNYFNKIFSDSLVFYQVGCYYETYLSHAETLSHIMHYRLRSKWRGMKKACGFHKRYLHKVCTTLEKEKISYAIIKQTGRYLNFTMEREPILMMTYK